MTPEELKTLFNSGQLSKKQVSAMVDAAQGELFDKSAFDFIGTPGYESQNAAFENLRGLGIEDPTKAVATSPWYKNYGMLSGIGDVAGGLAALYSTFDNAKTAKLQRSMMQTQLNNLKEDRADFKTRRAGFNAVPTTFSNKSAFVG